MEVFVATEAVHYDTATVLGVATNEKEARKIVDEYVRTFARPDKVKDWEIRAGQWIRTGPEATFYIEPHSLRGN